MENESTSAKPLTWFVTRPSFWRWALTFVLIGPINPVGIYFWQKAIDFRFKIEWELVLILPMITVAAAFLLWRLAALRSFRKAEFYFEIFVIGLAATAIAISSGSIFVLVTGRFGDIFYLLSLGFAALIVVTAPAALWAALILRILFVQNSAASQLSRDRLYDHWLARLRQFSKLIRKLRPGELRGRFESPLLVIMAWVFSGPLNPSSLAWRWLPGPFTNSFNEAFSWIAPCSALGAVFALLILQRMGPVNSIIMLGVFLLASHLVVALFPIFALVIGLISDPGTFAAKPELIIGVPLLMYIFGYFFFPIGPMLALSIEIPAALTAFVMTRIILYKSVNLATGRPEPLMVE